MARSDPMADASLPDIRARSRPGTAMAAMMPMIATTISNSMRVKPELARIFIFLAPSRKPLGALTRRAFSLVVPVLHNGATEMPGWQQHATRRHAKHE